MKTMKLGKTGVDVSAMCLGTMYFGTHIDEETAYQLLDLYVDAGGSFLDTANNYAWWVEGFAGGESESLLGRWMQARQNRDRLFLASKVGLGYPGVEPGLSADRIMTECEKSLQRLGTDVIDVYYAYMDDRSTPLEETLETFNKLIQAGKVRFIGSSNSAAWRMEEARLISSTNGWAEYSCIQQRHSFLQPKHGANFVPQMFINEDILNYARRNPITILAYSALVGEGYTVASRREHPTDYESPYDDASYAVLETIAAEKNVTANQVLLAWMLRGDPQILPLIGVSRIEDLKESLDALDLELTPEDIERLDQVAPDTRQLPIDE